MKVYLKRWNINLSALTVHRYMNKEIAKMGGNVSKVARDDIEKKLGGSIISKENSLPYQYVDDKNKIENQ